MRKISLSISLIIFLLISTLFAQDPINNGKTDDLVIPLDTNLVVLDLTVLDKNGNFVSGLKAESLKVYEDKVEQKIEVFTQESVPISFGLVIDTSGSMRFKLPMVVNAAKEMLNRCKKGDEVFIISMKDAQNIELIQPFTEDFLSATKALNKFTPGGGTALLDGILDATEYAQIKAKNRRKALVIMSDGDDRSSSIDRDKLINELRASNAQVYLLGFPEGFTTPDGKFIDYTLPKAKKLLEKIAQESGGETFFPTSMTEIFPILDRICIDLRTQYTIGYEPKDANDGRFHSLEVKLTDKKSKYTIRTRTGYFAKKRMKENNF
ncbi:MAG: VWA domain-containing protein [Acidobacteria bacterium]|nr:VWA domain-containing protein [Acidobacteriota bacterium]